MDTEKTFAFRLAADKARDTEPVRWTIRDDVAIAGCTDPTRQGNVRYSGVYGVDSGPYC